MNDFDIELLVAEKIMGYTWRQWRDDMKKEWEINSYTTIASAEWRRGLRFLERPESLIYQSTEPAVMSKQTRYACKDGYVRYPSGTSVEALMLPHWSTEMSEATKVIEKLNSMGYFVAVATAPGKPTKCFVQYVSGEKLGPELEVEATGTGLEGAMARAICLACLEAVGAIINEKEECGKKGCCKKKQGEEAGKACKVENSDCA